MQLLRNVSQIFAESSYFAKFSKQTFAEILQKDSYSMNTNWILKKVSVYFTDVGCRRTGEEGGSRKWMKGGGF